MKTCSKCGVEKDLSAFYKRKDRACGVGSHCKECVKTAAKENWSENKEERLQKSRDRWEKKKEQYSATAKKWREANKGYIAATTKARKALKINRTPKWADLERIKAYYNVCAFFNEINGYAKYHVDHVVPLQGKTVSGLHVHSNLQVIPAKDNLTKGNKWN